MIAGLLDGVDFGSLDLRVDAFPEHEPLVAAIVERSDSVERESLKDELPSLAELIDEIPAHERRQFLQNVERVRDLHQLRRLIEASHDVARVVESQDRRRSNPARRRFRLTSLRRGRRP